MATPGEGTGLPPKVLCEQLDVTAISVLGGRASQNWEVRRGSETLVLRAHQPALWQAVDQLELAIRWRAEARRRVRELGWPAARPVGEPVPYADPWWTLEELLPGSAGPVPPDRHAALLSDFHALDVDVATLGAQPGRLDHLAVLGDDSAEAAISSCHDGHDRSWLRRRLDQARTHAAQIDWAASQRVLVHGDFAPQNLLWTRSRLTGLLDFELANVDRRVVDFTLSWRCRHDDVLLGYDAITPLTPDEWRMLLVDWWSSLVSLAVVQLRRGNQPDRWELDGLRRVSPLSSKLERGNGMRASRA